MRSGCAVAILLFATLALALPSSDSFKQAEAAFSKGNYAEAVKGYSKAAKDDPSCQECVRMLAIAYAKSGDEKNSKKAGDRALAMAATASDRAAARVGRAEAIVVLAGKDAKKVAEAEPELRSALQEVPGLAVAHMDLGIVLIRSGRQQEGIEELRQYLALGKNQGNLETVRGWIEHPRSLRDPVAPEFAFVDVSGTSMELSALRGKVVVLDFWATWCGPCRASVGELKDFRKKYSPEGVVLISVSADSDESKWKQFIAERKMDWPQHWDQNSSARKAFGVHAFPTYLVIDKEGYVVERIDGMSPTESVGYRLRSQMKTLLSSQVQ